FQSVIEDVSDLKRAEEAIRRRAVRDEVLRDVSRRMLDEDLDAATSAALADVGRTLGAQWAAAFKIDERDEALLHRTHTWMLDGLGTDAMPPESMTSPSDVRGIALGPIGYGPRLMGLLVLKAPRSDR